MFILISVILILLSVYLYIKRPFLYVAYFGIVASSSSAQGIVGFLDTYFSYYFLIQSALFLLFGLHSTKKLLKSGKRYRTLTMIMVLLMVFGAISVFSNTFLNPFPFIFSFCNLMPLSLLILLAHPISVDKSYRIFNFFLIVEIGLAFLICYLPLAGIDSLSPLSGANYVLDGDLLNQEVAELDRLENILIQKNFFNGLGQFHNNNVMGFFGVVGVFWFIYYYFTGLKKILWLPICLLFVVLSIAIWFNGAARGPLIGLAVGMIAYLFIGSKKNKLFFPIIAVIVFAAVYIVFSNNDLLSFFFDRDNISYTGRQDQNELGYDFLIKHLLFGAGGDLASLTAKNIDPHELPFRMACVFGIIPGVMTILLYYILPAFYFIKSKSKSMLSLVFYGIFFFMTMTNNYASIILSLFLFYFAVTEWLNGDITLNRKEKI